MVGGIWGSKDLEADHIRESSPQMKNWGTVETRVEWSR